MVQRDTARFVHDIRYEQDVSGFTCATCYKRDIAHFAHDTRYE